MNAITLFTAEVFGVLLRVLECEGKRWLCTEDASKILGYRTQDGLIVAFNRHKEKLTEHSIKAKINGAGKGTRLFDEFTLRYLCEYSKKVGAAYLLRWLNSGGLQAASADEIPFDKKPVKTAVGRVYESHLKGKNILPFKKTLDSKSKVADTGEQEAFAARIELERVYCTALLDLLLEHSEKIEIADKQAHLVADIRDALEDLIDSVLQDTYSPKLNTAYYDLFSSFFLPEGEQ